MRHRHAAIYCLQCGHKLDGATNADHVTRAPKDGDLSICLYCHHVAVFTSDGLRYVRPDELQTVLRSLERLHQGCVH